MKAYMTKWSLFYKEDIMPQETFFNLPDNKRNLIISAAMHEFSKNNYKTASINKICKKANIPKGSFYQYFTDKLDLYVYIMSFAIEKKVKFFSDVISKFNTLTMFKQLRLLFVKGIEFAKKYPLYAELGEQFSKEHDELAKSAVIKAGDKQAQSLFMQMICNAKMKGEIDGNVDSFALCLLLKTLNSTVNEYMLEKSGNACCVYSEEELLSFVDSLLKIVFCGILNKT